jgi:bifunctional N-acetylglucosamine-1-phosphate-uridyltransferase/glucosamine-1-phosphate-acetyltransferase GlmU-like protein
MLASFTTLKPLIHVGEIPMIIWPISNLPLESDDLLVIVTKKGDNLEPICDSWLKRIPYRIVFVEMDSLSEGPSSTIEASLGELDLDLPLVVLNSDQYVRTLIRDYVEALRNSESEEFGRIVTMFATGTKWSYIGRGDSGEIERIVEKQEISTEATVGIYAWTKAHLFAKSLENMKRDNFRVNNEYYVAPTYNYLVSDGIKIETFNVGSVGQSVHGLGTPEDLSEFLASSTLKTNQSRVFAEFKS